MNSLLDKNANGYSWKKATLMEKSEYCDIQAKGFKRDVTFAPNLMKQLDDLFSGDSDTTLRSGLSSSVALIVGIPTVLSQLPPRKSEEPPSK